MKIVGFNFSKISAERESNQVDNLEVKSSIDIKDVDKAKSDLFKEEEIVGFKFNYIIDYSPNFAKIIFEGSILLLIDEKTSKNILKDWKKKEVSEDVKVPLFNLILQKANIKALGLEEELGLPPHLPLPKIKKTSK